MRKGLQQLLKLAIVLFVLCLAGLVVDYFVYPDNFPNVFTLAPTCLLIITLLIMLVINIFRAMISQE